MAPTALLEHDNALRAIRTAVRAARAAGASDRSILEPVVAGLLDLELLGREERTLAEDLALDVAAAKAAR